MPRQLVLRGSVLSGDVHVVDGKIAASGDAQASQGRESVLDTSGCLVTPGLINTHHHLFQRMLRGRGVGCDLLGWLRELLPLWSTLAVEDMVAAARLAAAELALGGVTTTVDHHFVVPHGDESVFDAIAGAVADIGLRLVLCRGAIDLTEKRGGFIPDNLAEDPQVVATSVERLVQQFRDNPLVDVAVAPSSLFAVTKDLLEAAVDVATRTGCGLHLHMSESETELDYSRQRFGRDPVDLLDDLGWLAQGMWLAHGIHFDERSRQKLGNAGVGVAHCPAANARLGAGVADSVALARAGCHVGIGTDGAAANDFGGMLAQVRLAWWLASARGGALACTPHDAWGWATTGGAKVIGRSDLGTMDVGAPADLAVWDVEDLADFKVPEHGTDLLVLGPDRPVRHLIVAGEPVVVDGVVVGVDIEELRADVAARTRRAAKAWDL